VACKEIRGDRPGIEQGLPMADAIVEATAKTLECGERVASCGEKASSHPNPKEMGIPASKG